MKMPFKSGNCQAHKTASKTQISHPKALVLYKHHQLFSYHHISKCNQCNSFPSEELTQIYMEAYPSYSKAILFKKYMLSFMTGKISS